jgi:hypothetical protein
MSSPLVIGPLQAYRYWRVKWQEGQPVLRSVYNPTTWPTDVPLRAICAKGPESAAAWIRSLFSRKVKPPDHSAPAWGCCCGVYGFASLAAKDLREPPYYPGESGSSCVSALGAVLLWGRVVQHAHGYRAEFARPLKLLQVTRQAHASVAKDLLGAAAERYGIRLVTYVADLA